MEKSVLKKVIQLACLACTAWLVGCAQTPHQPSDATSATTAQTASSATSVRQSPPGNMRPVYPSNHLTELASSQFTSQAVHQLNAPADIWDRIRRGFAMPDLDNDLVRGREQWYASRPDYVQRMTARGSKYLFHIVEELELRNMPTELALLPFIESAYNPQAVSSARAAGMWQFMPATGKDFSLKQNMFRDDRRDVLASTRAALTYLQRLYGMFGDWHLALAAYNWGEGSVGRAIGKSKRAGFGTSYTEIKMPMETQFYVPKLQAVKNIVANPERFGAVLPNIENHPYFQSVDINRDIDVSVAAKLAQVSLEDFRALNPSASKPVLLAAGTPQILLPWDNAAMFQANLEAYTGGPLASWTAWIAPTTMTPADAAKRVDMPEAELRAINHIPARMLIKAGSTLVVRRAGALDTDVSSHIADHGFLALAPDRVLRRSVVKARKKDSVVALAKRYRVSPSSVADWNNIGVSATFKAGQNVVLMLPVKSKATRSAKAPSRRTASASSLKASKSKSSASAKGKTKSKATATKSKKTAKPKRK